jgi:hypothetical protein
MHVTPITDYLSRQADSSAADSGLRYYGLALALVNVVTAAFWLMVQPVSHILDGRTAAICWPFFESCYQCRFLGPESITLIVVAFGVASCVNATLFMDRPTAKAGYWLLLICTIWKAAILLLDYRLVMNQHYMAIAVTIVYLFLRSRERAIQYLVVCFYFWAGLLKLNTDWLFGAALYGRRPFGMPEALIPWACAYVIVLELAIVWGLLSKRPIVFWLSFAQFMLFHLGSWWVVGFFYPLLMACLLSIFVLSRLPTSTIRSQPVVGLRSVLMGAEHPLTYVLLVGFTSLQLVPRLLPGNPSLTGEGRMFALNMFDAPVFCHASVTLRSAGRSSTYPLRVPYLQPRIQCDPIVFREAVEGMCRTIRSSKTANSPSDIDLRLESKRASDATTHVIVDVHSMCSAPIQYHVLQHNQWINVDPS